MYSILELQNLINFVHIPFQSLPKIFVEIPMRCQKLIRTQKYKNIAIYNQMRHRLNRPNVVKIFMKQIHLKVILKYQRQKLNQKLQKMMNATMMTILKKVVRIICWTT